MFTALLCFLLLLLPLLLSLSLRPCLNVGSNRIGTHLFVLPTTECGSRCRGDALRLVTDHFMLYAGSPACCSHHPGLDQPFGL